MINRLLIRKKNRAPNDISLSVSAIAENNSVGDVIGAFSITDPDTGNTFTYSLVAGTGSTDNASFSIDGANLKAGIAFNYEAKSSYSIRVRSTDQGGLYFEKQFTIAITDVVEIDLNYVSASNAAAALTIPTYDGSNQLVHPSVYYNADGWNGHKYWMGVTPYPFGNNIYENPSIVVSEDGITWVVPEGITNPIEAKPDGGFNADPNLIMGLDGKLYLFFVQVISGTVTCYVRSSSDGITWDAKQAVTFTAPENIGSPSVLLEGSTYVMYYIHAETSPNILRKVTSSSPLGPWSAPVTNTIAGMPAGREAWHIEVKNFENIKHAFLVTATATETGGGSTLYFAESSNGVDWTMKEDPLVALSSGWDNSLIYKTTGILFTSGVNNYYYKIWYSAMSSGGVWKVGLTTVYLNNKVPTDIALSVSSIAENNAIGDVIGAFSTTDPDTGNTFTYSLASGTGSTDNASFSIDVANLKAGTTFDYETKASYSIRIRSTDQGGFFFEKQFTITIAYVNPPLSDSLISVWEMDDVSGTLATDSHAANDLEVVGATINQAGKIGQAISFDGSGDYLRGTSNIVSGFPYSVSAWVKVNAGSVNMIESNFDATKYYGVQSRVEQSQLIVQFGNGVGLTGDHRITFRKVVSLTSGNWYHMVVIATAHGVFKYYLNGVEQTIPFMNGGAASTSFANGKFYIGNTINSPNALIDQVAVWNRALSADHVALLYNSGNGLAYSSF